MNKLTWSNQLRLLLVFTLLATSCSFGRGAEDPTPTPGQSLESGSTIRETPAPPLATVAPDTPSPTAPPLPKPAATIPLPQGTAVQLAPSVVDLPTLPSFVPPPGSPPAFSEALARASRMQPLLGELQAEIDSGQFDLLALNSQLGFDAPTLIRTVQSQIAFEQYPGVLRGPRGTLISGAGNALDQALLLGRLLDDAGYETRLARTTLSPDLAAALLNQMAVPRLAAPSLGDNSRIEGLMSQLNTASGGSAAGSVPSAEETAALVAALTAADTDLILDGLAAAGLDLDGTGILDNLVAEAQDYFWVQYRLSSFDDWQNAHAAFTEPAAAPAGLTPQETYREGPPPELYHRLRLEIFVEQKFDDQLQVNSLLEGWEKPAAELFGQPITLQNQPNNLDLDSAAAPEDLLQRTGIILPLINGELATNGFDLDGRVFGAGLVALDTVGMTELFQSAAAGAEVGTGLIGSLGEETEGTPDDFLTLTAQWIEYTLVAPDGRETTTRRYVMDRLGEENRAAGLAEITDPNPLLVAAQALLTTHTIIVLPGAYNRGYRASRAIDRTLNELELLAYINPDGSLISFPEDVINELTPLQDVLLSGAFANGTTGQADLLAYRPSPTVVVYQEGLVPAAAQPTAFERVDVLHNASRVFDISDGQVRPDPAAAVRLGVWETLAERVLLQGTGQLPTGALQAIRDAAAAGIPLQVIPPNEPQLLQALPHSPETLASAAADLAAGYAIIMPERPLTPGEPTGWWRVDPRTGETLGIGTGGYGQAYVEYLISLKLGALFAVIGYNNCRAAGGSAGCCLYENLALLAIGFTIGYFIGAIAVTAGASEMAGASLGLVLGDVGLGIAGIFNPVSICS